MKKILILAVGIFLYGCAMNSGIVPIGSDTYMVSRQAATGFFGLSTLKAEAIQEATRYCEGQGKRIQTISSSEAVPPYILGNYPRTEVQFKCL